MTRRLAPLDALRGFALIGIVLGNVMWFSGYAVSGAGARAASGDLGVAIDAAVAFVIHLLVDGKFYGLFSLLFGASFSEMLRHTDAPARRVRRLVARRLSGLWAIGIAHATLVWFGDILSLYAVAAVPLLAVRRWSPRRLVLLACGCLAAPVGMSLALWAVAAAGGAAGSDPGHGPSAFLPAFASGGYLDVLPANAAFLAERWVLAIRSGRLVRLLGMFVLGMLLVRSRPTPSRRSRTLLLVVAGASNLGLALLADVPMRPPSALGVVRDAVYAVAVPSGALAYAVVLWPRLARGGRLAAALGSAGRLSLTHYLTQSLTMMAIFYGCGLGWWGHVGASGAAAIAIVLVTAQIALSGPWLRRCGAGPGERLLRALIHGLGRAPHRS